MVDERENEQPGDLRSIVKRRRIRVYDQLNEQFQADVISEVIFDLLVHLALNADAELGRSCRFLPVAVRTR